MTRWQTPHNLENVLREITSALEPDAVPRGYSVEQITRREIELCQPMPADIRLVYEWFTPLRWKAAIKNDAYAHVASPWFTNPYLVPLEQAGWRTRAGAETSFNFCFAASDMGEEIVYCANPPELDPGLIVCWYQTIPHGLILGNSLAQWLARFHECGDREYAFAPGTIDPTDDDKQFDGEKGLEEPLRSDFLRDHLRLNPNDDYSRKLLSHKFGK